MDNLKFWTPPVQTHESNLTTLAPIVVSAFEYFGMSPDSALQSWQDVTERYAEVHRSYHDQSHLFEGLATLAAPSFSGVFSTSTLHVAVIAWIFHDVIYHTTPPKPSQIVKSNELLSAGYFLEVLGYYSGSGKEIETLVAILDTSHESAPKTPTGQFVCDLDLLRLAAEPTMFDLYSTQVFKEYGVKDEDIDKAMATRRQILKKFLDKPRIFNTSIGAPYEAAARWNLERL